MYKRVAETILNSAERGCNIFGDPVNHDDCPPPANLSLCESLQGQTPSARPGARYPEEVPPKYSEKEVPPPAYTAHR